MRSKKRLPKDGPRPRPATAAALPFVEDVQSRMSETSSLLGLFRAVESEILDFGSTAIRDVSGNGNNVVGGAGAVAYEANGFGPIPGARITAALASGNVDLGFQAYAITGYFRDISLVDAIFAYIGAAGAQVFGRVNGAGAGVLGAQVANPNINRAQSTSAYSMEAPAVVTVIGDLSQLIASAEPDIRYGGASVYNTGTAVGGNTPPLADGPLLLGGGPGGVLPIDMMAGAFAFYAFDGARELDVVSGVEAAVALAVARGNWE